MRAVSPAPSELRYGLETGEIDLAIGYFPDLVEGDFYQQQLFTNHFTCLLRADHPIRGRKLTQKQFLELKHVSVRDEGRSQEPFERFLLSKAIHRKIVLYTPHFMSLPMIIARSDLVATVPHVIGIYYSNALANIKMMSLPMAGVPQIALRQHWHRRFHKIREIGGCASSRASCSVRHRTHGGRAKTGPDAPVFPRVVHYIAVIDETRLIDRTRA